ncbi:YdeI/OmpD-associated family protein [Streptomyces vulcanius]|uniref:Mutator family transposase n=3 Tax=Streptomyces TaxID=1883 RepID=A0ABV9IL83_9ACTN
MVQELIEAEATAHVGAEWNEHTPTRTNVRNGHREKVLTTLADDLDLEIPKVRTGSFFPSLLERRRRIDQAFDDQWWLQRFTPRKPRSKWSKANRDKVAALIEQGRMHPAGQAEIDRAKADGRWEAAYDGAKNATVPDDLAAVLTADPAAAEFFGTLDLQNRYAILYRVQDAKKPETRARRIEKYVAMLAKGEKLYP